MDVSGNNFFTECISWMGRPHITTALNAAKRVHVMALKV